MTQGGPRCPTCRQRTGKKRGYTPDKTANYEDLVGWTCRSVYRGRPSRERISMSLIIYDVAGRRCDASNVQKAIEDGLNGVAYVDDSQIDEYDVQRARVPEMVGVDVCVFTLGDGDG